MERNPNEQESCKEVKSRNFFVTCWIYAIMSLEVANLLGIGELSLNSISVQPVWSILNLAAIGASTLFVMWGCNDLLDFIKKGLTRTYIGGIVNLVYPLVVYSAFGDMDEFFYTMAFAGIMVFLLRAVVNIRKNGVPFREVLQ